jgi:hypothetical protein
MKDQTRTIFAIVAVAAATVATSNLAYAKISPHLVKPKAESNHQVNSQHAKVEN